MGFQRIREKAIAAWKADQCSEKTRILIGMGTCGKAAGAEDILKVLQEEVQKENIQTSRSVHKRRIDLTQPFSGSIKDVHKNRNRSQNHDRSASVQTSLSIR